MHRGHWNWEAERNSGYCINFHQISNNQNNYTLPGFVARPQAICLSAKETKNYLDSSATLIRINKNDLLMDFVENDDEFVRTYDQHTDIKSKRSILVPIGDGPQLLADYTPSFVSNVISLNFFFRLHGHDVLQHNRIPSERRLFWENAIQIPTKGRNYLLPDPAWPDRAKIPLHWPTDTARNRHNKLGHPGTDPLLQSIDKSEGIPRLSINELRNINCSPCIEGGTRRALLLLSSDVKRCSLELIHVNCTGTKSLPSRHGSTYIQILLEDNTKSYALQFLSAKSLILLIAVMVKSSCWTWINSSLAVSRLPCRCGLVSIECLRNVC